jgi:6-phospho-3-hexuloisomerase
MSGDWAIRGRQACEEIAASVGGIDETAAESLVEALAAARRIALVGVGREGLMMRALAMRLFHLGLDAHPVGDMTTPALGSGDLLLASAGPGSFSTVMALIGVARSAGARVAVITAQAGGAAAAAADVVVTVPAQTMATDTGAGASAILSMGSAYEGAQYVVFELLVLRLRQRLGITPEAMRARHTNLE